MGNLWGRLYYLPFGFLLTCWYAIIDINNAIIAIANVKKVIKSSILFNKTIKIELNKMNTLSNAAISNILDPETFVKVMYIDTGMNSDPTTFVSVFTKMIKLGVNVIILAFYISNGPTDMAAAWQGLSSTEQLKIKTMLHKNNVVLLCSFGGSTTCPTECTPTKKGTCGDCDGCTFNYPPVSWFIKNNLDGIDLDLENFGKSGTSGTFTPCMTTLVNYIADFRKAYTAGKKCIVTSAPQSPHFSGGYGLDYSNPNFSNTFDWLNIQYYNDASGCTQNNQAWLTGPAAMGAWAGCNLKYITKLGIDPTKIVVGKCGQGCPLSSSYVGAVKLEEWVKSASQSYKGIMYWEWCKDCSGGPIPGAVWLTDSAPNCCANTSTCMAWDPVPHPPQSGITKAWCTGRCTNNNPTDPVCISGTKQDCECTEPVRSYRCDPTSQCCDPSTKSPSETGGYANYNECATVCSSSSPPSPVTCEVCTECTTQRTCDALQGCTWDGTKCAKSSPNPGPRPGPKSGNVIKVIILISCLLLLGTITVFVYFKLKARKK